MRLQEVLRVSSKLARLYLSNKQWAQRWSNSLFFFGNLISFYCDVRFRLAVTKVASSFYELTFCKPKQTFAYNLYNAFVWLSPRLSLTIYHLKDLGSNLWSLPKELLKNLTEFQLTERTAVEFKQRRDFYFSSQFHVKLYLATACSAEWPETNSCELINVVLIQRVTIGAFNF